MSPFFLFNVCVDSGLFHSFLDDFVIATQLLWPTPVVQWLPLYETNDSLVQRLIIGTRTDNTKDEKTYVEIKEVSFSKFQFLFIILISGFFPPFVPMRFGYLQTTKKKTKKSMNKSKKKMTKKTKKEITPKTKKKIAQETGNRQ